MLNTLEDTTSLSSSDWQLLMTAVNQGAPFGQADVLSWQGAQTLPQLL